MLFACGVGTGVFFYGVAEPIYHYTGANRYSADHALPDNKLAQVSYFGKSCIRFLVYYWS